MAIEVTTKDTTALSDAELAEMGDMCATGPVGFELGMLSKHAQEWVLVSQARNREELVGFSFATLERIGGTPSLLVGLAACADSGHQEEVLVALLGEHYAKALLAFPDEDVLFATRLATPAAFRAFSGLTEIVPRPEHRASGEERAWGRRLAKRFGADGRIDDRTFVLEGDGAPAPCFAFDGPPPQDEAIRALFASLDASRGDCLVAFGWAMAEDLAANLLPR